ncbi:MAG: hypothetical protein IJ608_07360, partial [Lachnospiraceae bacterium]|nr:hypothetical protein [Lachnospiraceae bacterium]
MGNSEMTMHTSLNEPAFKNTALRASARYCSASHPGPVMEWCGKAGVEPAVFFTAAFGIALRAFTGAESADFDVLCGGADPTLAGTLLPMTFEPAPEQSLREIAEETGRLLSEAEEKGASGSEEADGTRENGASVLFACPGDTRNDKCMETGGDAVPETAETKLPQAKASLSVSVWIDGDKISCQAEWDPSQYSRYSIDAFVKMYDRVISEFAQKEKAGEISLVGEDEEEAIRRLHDTDWPVAERPAYRLLQDSAEKYPERKALIAVDRTLTYRELNEEANAVGHALS